MLIDLMPLQVHLDANGRVDETITNGSDLTYKDMEIDYLTILSIIPRLGGDIFTGSGSTNSNGGVVWR
jgi:hypothetical protein